MECPQASRGMWRIPAWLPGNRASSSSHTWNGTRAFRRCLSFAWWRWRRHFHLTPSPQHAIQNHALLGLLAILQGWEFSMFDPGFTQHASTAKSGIDIGNINPRYFELTPSVCEFHITSHPLCWASGGEPTNNLLHPMDISHSVLNWQRTLPNQSTSAVTYFQY